MRVFTQSIVVRFIILLGAIGTIASTWCWSFPFILFPTIWYRVLMTTAVILITVWGFKKIIAIETGRDDGENL